MALFYHLMKKCINIIAYVLQYNHGVWKGEVGFDDLTKGK
jgi:hypothetical protein